MSKLKLKKKRHKESVPKGDDIRDDDKDEAGLKTTKIDKEARMNKVTQMGIESARKHNIKMEPGRGNSGDGNCSYQSVIFNINDRECFKTKLPMSPDFYRRMWTIDLMNKIIDRKIPWNPGMTNQEIQDGFQELMVSGVYEKDFFGDMMLPGIACGVGKRILIFNTNVNITTTGHDPISVVDPRDYGSDLDSEIPVVLAYNLVHFESLHPVDELDIEKTIKLVNSYSAGSYKDEYGFARCDIPHLISEETELNHSKSPPPKKMKKNERAQNKVSDATKKNPKKVDETEDFIFEDIRFRETGNCKVKCGICEVECTRLIVHMNGNKYCTAYFSNMTEFKQKYSEFRHKRSQRKNVDELKGEDKDFSKDGKFME